MQRTSASCASTWNTTSMNCSSYTLQHHQGRCERREGETGSPDVASSVSQSQLVAPWVELGTADASLHVRHCTRISWNTTQHTRINRSQRQTRGRGCKGGKGYISHTGVFADVRERGEVWTGVYDSLQFLQNTHPLTGAHTHTLPPLYLRIHISDQSRGCGGRILVATPTNRGHAHHSPCRASPGGSMLQNLAVLSVEHVTRVEGGRMPPSG